MSNGSEHMKERSVSDRFHDFDKACLEELGSPVVDSIMVDIRNRDLSLRDVAVRNGVTTGTVVQVARFHKIDPVTLEDTD